MTQRPPLEFMPPAKLGPALFVLCRSALIMKCHYEPKVDSETRWTCQGVDTTHGAYRDATFGGPEKGRTTACVIDVGDGAEVEISAMYGKETTPQAYRQSVTRQINSCQGRSCRTMARSRAARGDRRVRGVGQAATHLSGGKAAATEQCTQCFKDDRQQRR